MELGYSLRTEVVGDGGTGGLLVQMHSQSSKHNMGNCAQWAVLLETDVGVDDNKTAENGVHNGVERTGSEGGDGERNETHTDSSVHQLLVFGSRRQSFMVQLRAHGCDEPLESPVVAALGWVSLGYRNRVVHYGGRLISMIIWNPVMCGMVFLGSYRAFLSQGRIGMGYRRRRLRHGLNILVPSIDSGKHRNISELSQKAVLSQSHDHNTLQSV